jgi:hypothetical protein
MCRPRSSRPCSSRSRTATRRSTRRWRPQLSSSELDLWQEIALDAESEGSLWREALRPRGARDREPVFSPLTEGRFALAVETIYEGYLVHYGRPRLFAPGDHDTILLLGDYLYAHGLVRLATAGSVEAVADMGELISLCAQLRAEGSGEDGPVWAASVALLGQGVLKETDDPEALVARAKEAAGDEPVERALKAHRKRVR